jgi:Transmembrane domain of unknown function (DUF3566)
VSPDPGISATAVADPLLAADVAAAEASNGSHADGSHADRDHADGDHPGEVTAPAAVTAATAAKPKQRRPSQSSKQRKTAAAAKVTSVGAATAAVDVVELPPTEQVEAIKSEALKTDAVKIDAKLDSVVSAGQPTPSSGVPMVALIPPAGAVETVAAPTTPTPTVTAPTAATVAAATAVAPALAPVVAPATAPQVKQQSKPPKVAAAPRRRVRARRVQRIVRRVDAWSVMKVSFVFFIVMYLVLLVAGVLLWAFAVGTGTIDNVENFIEQLFALDSFSFVGAQILRASIIGGGLLVIAGTFTTTVLAVLFNLISDLVGGVRFTVVEEQVLRPVSPPRPAPGAAVPSSVDDAPSRPGTV